MKTFWKYINRLEEAALGMGLLALALMAFLEVVKRYFFNHSFTWFEEFSRYFCLFLTFLGASLGVKYGMHFSMDYLVMRVGPRPGCLLRISGALISATVFLLVAWYGLEHTIRVHGFGTTSAAMGLPMFWVYLPIPVFCFILSLRLLIQAWEHIKAFSTIEPLTGREVPPATNMGAGE